MPRITKKRNIKEVLDDLKAWQQQTEKKGKDGKDKVIADVLDTVIADILETL